jgi:hypothetical protein
MVICLGWPLPATSSSLPAAYRKSVGVGHTSPPIWPCSDWGLPCRRCYQLRGGLLPHRFTLTLRPAFRPDFGRSILCGPVRRLAAPRSYLAVHPMELGLSSSALRHPRPSCSTSGGNIAGKRESGEPLPRFPHPAWPTRASPRCACWIKGSSAGSASFHWASTWRYSSRASALRPSRS